MTLDLLFAIALAAADGGAAGPAAARGPVFKTIENAPAFYWMVDGERGPTCQAWKADVSTRRRHAGGFSEDLVQEVTAAGGRVPVRLTLEHDNVSVKVFNPRVGGLAAGMPHVEASLGNCVRAWSRTSCDGFIEKQSWIPQPAPGVVQMRDGPRWFLDDAGCRAALAHDARPSDRKTCAPLLSRVADGVDASGDRDPLAFALAPGKTVFRQTAPGEKQNGCQPSRVTRARDGGAVLRVREVIHAACEDATYETTVEVGRLGRVALVNAPVGKTVNVRRHPCEGTGGYGRATVGCAGYLLVRPLGAGRLAVGGEIWYLTRAACEQDAPADDTSRN